MKTLSSHYSFKEVLKRLSTQDPEEKIRYGFQLNQFVNKIRKTGQQYEKLQTRHRTGAIA